MTIFVDTSVLIALALGIGALAFWMSVPFEGIKTRSGDDEAPPPERLWRHLGW